MRSSMKYSQGVFFIYDPNNGYRALKLLIFHLIDYNCEKKYTNDYCLAFTVLYCIIVSICRHMIVFKNAYVAINELY